MKKNVLVFPCGSEIGLEIYRSLCHSTHLKLWGGSSVPDHGAYLYKNYIEGLPFINDENFIKQTNELIEEYKIDYIIPAHDDVVLKLAQAASDNSLLCEVITSPLRTCEITRSKLQTYLFFEEKLNVPKVYKFNDELEHGAYPLFLKPDVGQGSKGTHKAESYEEIKFYKEKDPSLLIMEYLPGKEYTIDCFTDRTGKLRYVQGRQRKRISNGISVNSQAVSDERFLQWANKINESLEFRGVWFFQVKERADGDLVLMEIAPRIAGTMGVARNLGANLAILSIFDRMGFDLEVLKNSYEISIDRALENRYSLGIDYKHVYLDYDDLLIVEDQVNPQAVSFVFQCINKGVKVYLITKHANDLQESLNKHRLAHLFDEVIWIKKGEEKFTYIKEKDAIFIDDSFAERKAVFDNCDIPVFDSHMIESLIEKF